MTKSDTHELPVLPLRNLVLFPGVIFPIDVGRASSIRLVNEVAQKGGGARLVVTTQIDATREEPGPDDLHPRGVEAEVLKIVKIADQRLTVVLRGVERVRFLEWTQRYPYLVARVEPIAAVTTSAVEIDGLALAVR